MFTLLENSPLRIQKWKLWVIPLFIGVSSFLITNNVASFFIQFLFNFLLEDPSSFIEQNIHWIGLLQNVLMVLLAVVTVLVFVPSINKNNFGLEKTSTTKAISMALLFAFTVQISYFLLKNFQKIIGVAQEGIDGKEAFLALGFGNSLEKDIAIAILVGCAAPISEEFIYRGIILRIFRDKLVALDVLPKSVSNLTALLFSGLLFASIHGGPGQAAQFWGFVLISMIFGVVYLYSGSLKTSVMTHSFANIIGIIMGFIQYKNELSVNTTTYIILILPPVIAWVIMIFIEKIYPLSITPKTRYICGGIISIFFIIAILFIFQAL